MPSRPAGGFFEPDAARRRISELDHLISDPKAWSDPATAASLAKERSSTVERLGKLDLLDRRLADASVLSELAAQEGDAASLEEAAAEAKAVGLEAERWLVELGMSGPHDAEPCFLEVVSGQGGREAQDWASMLLRMYLRWAIAGGREAEIVDEDRDGDGLRSGTVRISGPNAYGWLRRETGAHRLVRFSPFGNGSRQTSFAAVTVTPDGEDAGTSIDIRETDVEVTTFRSSGNGGQNVQKVETAVRMKHIPSGTVAVCRRERSQAANKKLAWALLISKLEERRRLDLNAERDAAEAAKCDIGFGMQARSYVLAPNQLVRDERTGWRSPDPSSVLDGAIDGFLKASLAA